MGLPGPLRVLLILAAVLFLTAAPAHALEFLPLPGPDLLADPGFARPGYSDLAGPFLEKTRYLLSIDVDFQSGHVLGRARILFVNSTPDTLQKLVFRLYPNHPWYTVGADGGFTPQMIIHQVLVDRQLADWQVRDAWDTVLDVPLKTPVAPKGQAIVDIEYEIKYPAPGDSLELLEPYPLLAVYENGAWCEDVSTQGLDYVFSESALYAVRLRVTPDVSMWSTGVTLHTTTRSDSTTYDITTGPVREFVAMLAQGWREIDTEDGPVPIHVHYAGRSANAATIAKTAVDAMTYYDEAFGPYPYAELDVIAMNFPSGGEEYPTLIFCNVIGGPSYERFITAHEVAHQWFYGVAGNDIIRHAWLDESLAQISGYYFYKATYGETRANREYWPHITIWANRVAGHPKALETAVGSYDNFSDYMATVYGAGPIFLRDIADLIDEDRLVAGLWEYYHTVFFGVGTPDKFYDALQAQTDKDLAPLFCEHVGIKCPSEPFSAASR